RQLPIKGSIVECGVHHGGGVFSWAKLSSILEPYNYHRKVIGFDTFEGFPEVCEIDKSSSIVKKHLFGESYDVLTELGHCTQEYDANRFLNHIPKIELIRGDANQTIPAYVESNKHLLVSLLYLDFDLYKPTMTALKSFVPRIPKGGIIAFDEVNNPQWAGETMALLESLNLNSLRLECLPFEPNVSFIEL
ncbi:MAG: class I SAM-dependent methyltransferase, partial [Proteobacteria bacterium]|nr:class I SAM-dependent methyltransferase [Pseudomonadota bacterium]